MRLLDKKLILLKAGKKKPYYCEVEYLQSDGNQYINTGWVQGADYEEQICFEVPSTSQTIAGARNSNTRNGLFYWNNAAGTLSYTIAQSNSSQTPFQLGALSGDKLIRVKISNNVGNVWVDKFKIYDNVSFSGTYAQTYPLVLFGSNNAGTVEEKGSSKIRSFYGKSASGEIDLIPVLDLSGVPCMYDKISGRLLYNGGTGTFTYGREIHYVDWLETDGGQYFDTGFYGDQDTELSITAESRANASPNVYAQVGGCLVSGSNRSLTLNINNNNARNGVSVFGTERMTSGTEETFYSDIGQKVTFMSNKTGFYQNGVQKKAFGTVEAFTTTDPLQLLKANNSTATKAWRWYAGHIKWSGELRRDYVPMIDENGVGCAFDKVYHKIYDNAGTGTFKHSDAALEYLDTNDIEASKTAFINTGITYDNTKTYVIQQDIQINMPKYTGWSNCGSGWNAGGAIFQLSGYSWQYSTGAGVLDPAIQQGVRVKVRIVITPGTSYYTVINTESGVVSTAQRTNYSILPQHGVLGYPLMGSTSGGEYSRQCWGKLWSATISSGPSESEQTLLRNLTPVIRNGVAGMLDTVNNVFYNSAGSTQFAYKFKGGI